MIRFYNGSVLVFDPDARLTSDEVWTDGARIVYVGPARDVMPVFDRQIDLKGDILMPGFKDAHAHTPMTFLRSYAENLPLDRWLSEAIWPAEAKLTDEAAYDFTKLGIMEYLTSGITASFDMYMHKEHVVRANTDVGFRTVLCCDMNDFDKDVEVVERDFLRYNGLSDLVSFKLGMHAEYTTSLSRIEYVAGLAEKYRAPCWTHLSETKKETDSCIERYGMTPARFLENVGFFKYGGGGYHCVWLSEDDMDLFREKGLFAVINQVSNAKLASGIPQVVKMKEHGVKMAIGTDGAASNNSLDFFKEMFMITALQKVSLSDAAACPAADLLKMACVTGADAMGLADCDAIAEGKLADLVRIDMSRPCMQPLNNPVDNIVYAGSRDIVRMTMVNGKILYENGEFFMVEEPALLYARCGEFVRKLHS